MEDGDRHVLLLWHVWPSSLHGSPSHLSFLHPIHHVYISSPARALHAANSNKLPTFSLDHSGEPAHLPFWKKKGTFLPPPHPSLPVCGVCVFWTVLAWQQGLRLFSHPGRQWQHLLFAAHLALFMEEGLLLCWEEKTHSMSPYLPSTKPASSPLLLSLGRQVFVFPCKCVPFLLALPSGSTPLSHYPLKRKTFSSYMEGHACSGACTCTTESLLPQTYLPACCAHAFSSLRQIDKTIT